MHLFAHFINKLTQSRLQRDLSDSTVLRNLGVAFSYALIAYYSIAKGNEKLQINKTALQQDLNANWEVLAEAVQTVMRRYNVPDAYEQLKSLTRGQGIDAHSLKEFINGLAIPDKAKAQLIHLRPETYIGLAVQTGQGFFMKTELSQQGQLFEFDVLVLGTGLAGLHYCLQLVAQQPKIKIALISKAKVIESNSRYAQGGIAAACSSEDSLESHIADTLIAGDGLCYQPAVEFIIRQGPKVIGHLNQYLVPFKRNAQGQFNLAQEGGHSHRRIFNCGDQTGLSLIQSLYALIQQQKQIHVFEQHVAVNLITQYHPHRTDNQGEVLGAYILDCKGDQVHAFLANCVILATGGAGKTYRYTTNPMIATGDGVAMAYRAGARVGNMEFYQFHPTLLHHHAVNNFLISEAVRGEGGILKNPETGARFMQMLCSTTFGVGNTRCGIPGHF